MKKFWLLSVVAGILLTALLFTGCITVKIIASDETVPEADTAVVYLYSQKQGKLDGVTLTLKSLDGKPLPKGFRKDGALRVPAGEHVFAADAKWYSGLTVARPEANGGPYRLYFTEKNVQFTYDFKPGLSYYLEPVLEGGKGAKATLPMITTSFSKPRRTGGEPFLGQIAVYSVNEYDKQGFPIVSADMLIEKIKCAPEVSF
jgi:hypothetical protein